MRRSSAGGKGGVAGVDGLTFERIEEERVGGVVGSMGRTEAIRRVWMRETGGKAEAAKDGHPRRSDGPDGGRSYTLARSLKWVYRKKSIPIEKGEVPWMGQE
ncbi:hypothetical protein [Candidatus Methylacidithermus pantelleriae]|uniref:Uncharacterized protein n=1 Tax=Candidatus Methylacidithermus pantelleriae TaxID=2744239 RepID=A0A8J2BS45_9BACT|nr:hypothetical protein [Candidatus Methylacidithermus pantelleriae]CAF0703351.1 hypothetical protein MPNT_560007 [Candidatus Methylacidithermus pantelleriae]